MSQSLLGSSLSLPCMRASLICSNPSNKPLTRRPCYSWWLETSLGRLHSWHSETPMVSVYGKRHESCFSHTGICKRSSAEISACESSRVSGGRRQRAPSSLWASTCPVADWWAATSHGSLLPWAIPELYWVVVGVAVCLHTLQIDTVFLESRVLVLKEKTTVHI
jgi:hypothetical protein